MALVSVWFFSFSAVHCVGEGCVRDIVCLSKPFAEVPHLGGFILECVNHRNFPSYALTPANLKTGSLSIGDPGCLGLGPWWYVKFMFCSRSTCKGTGLTNDEKWVKVQALHNYVLGVVYGKLPSTDYQAHTDCRVHQGTRVPTNL